MNVTVMTGAGLSASVLVNETRGSDRTGAPT